MLLFSLRIRLGISFCGFEIIVVSGVKKLHLVFTSCIRFAFVKFQFKIVFSGTFVWFWHCYAVFSWKLNEILSSPVQIDAKTSQNGVTRHDFVHI